METFYLFYILYKVNLLTEKISFLFFFVLIIIILETYCYLLNNFNDLCIENKERIRLSNKNIFTSKKHTKIKRHFIYYHCNF